MKFSELWLREWSNITLDSETLLNQITMAGFEVESVEMVSGAFQGIVVGEVVECSQSLDNEKLWKMRVNVGNKDLLNIICGSPNCQQGSKVVVATVGAVLHGGIKVKLEKFCGELSEGILCSYAELGIFDYHNDIIKLPRDTPIGINIRDYLKLDDNSIDISVTPNRGDCLCIIGIARDLAVLNKTKLKIPNIIPVTATISDILPIQVDAADACPRYLGRVIKGIDIKARTPVWMKEKLRRCGISSLNAVVDVTNYVLLELGQPLHAFDKDNINGGIVVRMAKEGEMLGFLDGRKAKLNADTLIIADHIKPLAIAGVLSGAHSGVNEDTKNVLLECAFFSPVFIKNRILRNDLYTDVSHRYELGVDPSLQYKAMERATRQLIDICGGKAGPIIDVTNAAMLPKRDSILLRRSKLDNLIGYHISDHQVSDILRRLGCKVIEGEDWWQVVAPSWRFDMKIEEDLVEEIVRIYGYNNIPNKPVQAALVISGHREADLPLKRVKTLLNDKGYQEVITYSFVNPKVQELIHPGEEPLILPKPISKEMSAMRLSLLTGLLGTVIYNQKRQQSRIRIFENGLRFVPDVRASLGIRQDVMLGGAVCGNLYEEHWNLPRSSVDFYDIKGDLESLLDLTGKLSEIEFCAETIPALHPGQSAGIYLKDERIGFIGVVHPELELKLDLSGRTIVFELEWKKVAERMVPRFQDISRFPVNRRDISVVVAENIPTAAVLAECRKVGANQVVGVNLFDIYRGKSIGAGFKSLAISLIIQDNDRTLKKEEITATVAKCVEALKMRFQASLRD